MKLVLTLLAAVLCLGATQIQAQPRPYEQAELDSMLAPVALHPDGLVSQILIASTYPEEVQTAAGWSRANAHLRGEDAVRAVQNEPWDPAVKALVAFPELLARMAESPQWLSDLGQAFMGQQAQVMDTVQMLRRRAQGAGNLASNDQQVVYEQGQEIIVQPRTQVVYVPYYDPYVVYGSWWWPYYRPVYWSPWVVRPVHLSYGFFYAKPYWRHHHVHVVHRPVHHHHHVTTGKWAHRSVVAAATQHVPTRQIHSQPRAPRDSQRVPQSQRRPIAHSTPLQAAASSPSIRQSVRESIHDSPRTQPQRSLPQQQRVPEGQRRPIAHSTPLQAAAASPAIRQSVRESVHQSARDMREAPRQQQPRAQGVPAQPRAQAISPQSHGMPAAGGFSNRQPQGQARGHQQGHQGRGHRQ
jgi:hypothetical protein